LVIDVADKPRVALLELTVIINLHPLASVNPSVLVQLVSPQSLSLVPYGIRIKVRLNHCDRVQELFGDAFRRLSGGKGTESQQAE
jgi:hypothetical protein